jgi:heparan-alpha-glucosaminide N-acetyltransferase
MEPKEDLALAGAAPLSAAAIPAKPPAPRNLAVDVFRGFVMLLMMAQVMQLARVARSFPGNWFWAFLGFNQSHIEWHWGSLHDMIQPGFSFLVGVALPYSIASRIAKGKSFRSVFLHALWRSLLLIALGIFLRSQRGTQTNFTFEDTLTQIGLGYPFLVLLGYTKKMRWLWIALAVILFGYWAAWALYPVPAPGYDYQAVGVPPDWQYHYTGFMAHWEKNANLGQAFDVWFLNLFPRPRPWVANHGGYLTLSFIPTLGTMLLGLIAGRWYRAAAPGIPMRRFLIAGVAGVAAGTLLHVAGICPVVKKIWTPAFTLWSGGICFLFLVVFSWVVDVKKWRKWAFPLIVIGMNSIAAYMISDYFGRMISDAYRINVGSAPFLVLGPGLEPILRGGTILLTFWLILFWMYRRKIFLRI